LVYLTSVYRHISETDKFSLRRAMQETGALQHGRAQFSKKIHSFSEVVCFEEKFSREFSG
jgi:hypothetical protein